MIAYSTMARRDPEFHASKRDTTPHVVGEDVVERSVEMKRDNDQVQESITKPDGTKEYNMDWVFSHAVTMMKKRDVAGGQEIIEEPTGNPAIDVDYLRQHGFSIKKRGDDGDDDSKTDVEKRMNCWQFSSHC